MFLSIGKTNDSTNALPTSSTPKAKVEFPESRHISPPIFAIMAMASAFKRRVIYSLSIISFSIKSFVKLTILSITSKEIISNKNSPASSMKTDSSALNCLVKITQTTVITENATALKIISISKIKGVYNSL